MWISSYFTLHELATLSDGLISLVARLIYGNSLKDGMLPDSWREATVASYSTCKYSCHSQEGYSLERSYSNYYRL